MATYRVRFYKDITVTDVTNENIAVMIASGSDEGKIIPQNFSVETTLITE
jgi:hypothetical protein